MPSKKEKKEAAMIALGRKFAEARAIRESFDAAVGYPVRPWLGSVVTQELRAQHERLVSAESKALTKLKAAARKK